VGVILCFCGSGKTYHDCCLKSSIANGIPKPLKRYELWSLKYQERRYLEYLQVNDLVARAHDILTNITTLTEALKISLHPINPTGRYWMRLWSDVLTECRIRGYQYPYPLDQNIEAAKIPKHDLPGLKDAINTFKGLGIEEDTYWVKYGKYQFLKDTLEKGILRIAPASSYNDPSLNPAQQDDELKISTFSLPSEVTLEITDGKTGKPKGRINPKGNVKYTMTASSNYYVCCLALSFYNRLFGDFEADCALVIKDPIEFMNRLLPAFRKKLSGCDGCAQPVVYYDPLNPPSEQLPMYFSKHFRFWYQQEYRFIWIPPSLYKIYDLIFVEIGNLKDISEIICLT
jgi:SEC-C motif-containing protein